VPDSNAITAINHKMYSLLVYANQPHEDESRTNSQMYSYMGFVVDKAALGQVFSEYFDFPCQSSFHQSLHHHNHPGLA
jgi:hypothetical protein